MNIYELYGRQAEHMEQMREYFRYTQQGLRDLQEGRILPSQLVVTDNGWETKELDDGRDTETEDTEPARPSGAVPANGAVLRS